MDGAALIAEHERLGREARNHKRAANQHRQAARAARAEQAEIEQRCRQLGIAITFQSGEGDIHGRRHISGSAA